MNEIIESHFAKGLDHLNEFSERMFGFSNTSYTLQNIIEMMVKPALKTGRFEDDDMDSQSYLFSMSRIKSINPFL